MAPFISIEAKTGWSNDGPVHSSIGDAAMLQLWDAIVSSLRVRPTPPAKTGNAEQPQILPGHVVASAEPCPKAGWWTCMHDGPIEGERERHFELGETMPAVSAQLPADRWARLTRREQQWHTTPTSWVLESR